MNFRTRALLGMCLWIAYFAFDMRAATVDSIRSLFKAERTVEALHELEVLTRQSRGDPNALFEIGILFQELAGARAERLERLDPESPQVQELVGRSLESHNQTSEALVRYLLAARKDPTLPGIHFLIGNLYWKERDFDAALPELTTELHLNPNHSRANLRMGEILLATEADNPGKALPYLKQAAADPHAGVETHLEFGKALRMMGRYDESLKQLRWVVRQEPENNKVHAQLAAVYRAMGNSAAANREMEKQSDILRKQRMADIAAQQERAPR